MTEPNEHAPYGYDVWTHTEVVPKPPPIVARWVIRVEPKYFEPFVGSATSPFQWSEVTVQLTADQQVALSITGEDKYGNPVDISGEVMWKSSDEAIVSIANATNDSAIAMAVGPAGTASVTVTNDVNEDGTGDFQGSIAIDVVAGDIAEITIQAGEPTDKT